MTRSLDGRSHSLEGSTLLSRTCLLSPRDREAGPGSAGHGPGHSGRRPRSPGSVSGRVGLRGWSGPASLPSEAWQLPAASSEAVGYSCSAAPTPSNEESPTKARKEAEKGPIVAARAGTPCLAPSEQPSFVPLPAWELLWNLCPVLACLWVPSAPAAHTSPPSCHSLCSPAVPLNCPPRTRSPSTPPAPTPPAPTPPAPPPAPAPPAPTPPCRGGPAALGPLTLK